MSQPPRYAAIIDSYLARRLSLPDAARQLVEALAESGPVNLAISPKLRPLLAEVERLKSGGSSTGGSFLAADPDRHKDGNVDLLNMIIEHLWEGLAKYDHPTRVDCSFDAASKADADRISDWLSSHGLSVSIRSPAEADSDDWVVRGTSPSKQWTRELLTEWADVLRSAPLDGSASIHGARVLKR